MTTIVPASKAAQALIDTIEVFGDINVEINFPEPDDGMMAAITLPTQTSMPFTPNIYAPHGAIFSQN